MILILMILLKKYGKEYIIDIEKHIMAINNNELLISFMLKRKEEKS